MIRYIVEMDRTSESRILPNNTEDYVYANRIFDTYDEAYQCVKEAWARYNKENIYLMSIYQAKFEERTEYEGKAERQGIYRNEKCVNNIEDESPASLAFYTIMTHDKLALGLVSANKTWNLKTNFKV